MKEKKKISIVLPGGGAKCVYQFGFLYALQNSKKKSRFWDKYIIESIRATSGGAFVAAYFATDNMNALKEKMLAKNALTKLLVPWVNIPIIGSYLNIPVGFYKCSMYRKDGLYWMVDNVDFNCVDPSGETCVGLEKLIISVTDLDHGTHHYVTGRDPDLRKFIIASASLWGAFTPEIINGKLYADGGMSELAALSDNSSNLLINKPDKWNLKKNIEYLYIDTQFYDVLDNEGVLHRFRDRYHPGRNLLEYSMRVIAMTTSIINYTNQHMYLTYGNNKNIKYIKYPIYDEKCCQHALDFNHDKAMHTFLVGYKKGVEFLKGL